jgi:hypothetical protein
MNNEISDAVGRKHAILQNGDHQSGQPTGSISMRSPLVYHSGNNLAGDGNVIGNCGRRSTEVMNRGEGNPRGVTEGENNYRLSPNSI